MGWSCGGIVILTVRPCARAREKRLRAAVMEENCIVVWKITEQRQAVAVV